MRAVRITLERPDAVTESAVFARDQIGRAVADKIRTTKSAGQLKKVAEEVLPEIEKFLESPTEKRLRRLRTGMMTSFIGIGATVGAVIASMVEEDLFIMIIPAMIMLFIGLAIILNGLLLTIPRKQLGAPSNDAVNPITFIPPALTASPEQAERVLSSVTEHTTHQLKPHGS